METNTETVSTNPHPLSLLSRRRQQVERRVNRGLAIYMGTQQTRTLAVQRLRPFLGNLGPARESES